MTAAFATIKGAGKFRPSHRVALRLKCGSLCIAAVEHLLTPPGFREIRYNPEWGYRVHLRAGLLRRPVSPCRSPDFTGGWNCVHPDALEMNRLRLDCYPMRLG